jgi:cytidylate kinase
LKLKKNKILRITCDGGAATGKSTGAKLIAKKFGLSFLSSGLLYRYASYMILKKNPKNIINFLKKEFIKLNYKKLNNINLHLPKISEHSAIIAKIPAVRSILKKYQKNYIRKNKRCVLEGRDASTKILPNSDVKFFFICSLNIASKRRYKELKKNTKKIKLKDVKLAISKRNLMDKNRKLSPLQKHPDAVVVNTGKLNKQAMLAKMSKYVEKVFK